MEYRFSKKSLAFTFVIACLTFSTRGTISHMASSVISGNVYKYASGPCSEPNVLAQISGLTATQTFDTNNTISHMASSVIPGNVYDYASGPCSGPGHRNGTLNVAPSTLAQNNTDLNNVLPQISGLTATRPYGAITTAMTITGNGGLKVIDMSGNINLNDANLTLSGTSGVVGVTGGTSLAATAQLALSGTSPSAVIYDSTASSGTSRPNMDDSGDDVAGIMLSSTTSQETGFVNETLKGLIAKKTTTSPSNAPVKDPPSAAEPSSLELLGMVLLACAGLLCRRLYTKYRPA